MWSKVIEKRRKAMGSREREIGEIEPLRDLKSFIVGDSRNLGGHRLKANG
jgi:hypothetical protein